MDIWLFELWDNPTWFIMLILWWHPLFTYLWGHWNNYLNCEGLMHYCMWSISHWFGVQVLEPWVDKCSWGHYPKCWLQPNCESTFAAHLSLIKQHWCTLIKFGTHGSLVFELLSRDILDMQTLFFKLIIKTQVPKTMEEPRDENFITKFWHQLVTNNLMLIHPFKFMKFA